MQSAASQPPVVPVAYKDRKAGLVIFGIFTILFGTFVLLLVPMAFIGTAVAKNDPHAAAMMGNPVPQAIINALLATTLIWLGIGSITAKRWARAILVIASWSALLMGLTTAIFLISIRGRFVEMIKAAQPPNQPPLPPGADQVMIAGLIIMIGVFYILLPLAWALFYSGKNVKATCEARDPKTRWTDRCPLPVLAIVLWSAICAVMFLGLPMWHALIPAFGTLLTGPAAAVVYVILAAIWGYSAWSLYRLRTTGWWLLILTVIVFAISSALTYSRYSMQDIYQAMHYSPEQIAVVTKMLPPNAFGWYSVVFSLPFLAYLLYIRRFLAVRS